MLVPLTPHFSSKTIEFQRKESVFHGHMTAVSMELYPLLDSSKEDFLSPQELEFYKCLSVPRRKHSYLIGRYATKRSAASYLTTNKLKQIVVESGVFNNPLCTGPFNDMPMVSLSHTDSHGIAIATDRKHPVGIDIEKISTANSQIINKVTSPSELMLLKQHDIPTEVGLVLFWTAKEALAKSMTFGLMVEMEILQISSITPISGGFQLLFKNFHQYKCVSWMQQELAISLALPKKSEILPIVNTVPPIQ